MTIAIIFFALAAICHAVMEKYTLDYSRSLWKKVSPTHFFGLEGWWRKYHRSLWPDYEKNKKAGAGKTSWDINSADHRWEPRGKFWKWYYEHYDLSYRERFPFSATLLVFVTDAYHFFQWMMFNSFAMAMAATYHVNAFHVERWLITTMILRVGFTVVFYLFFEELLTKREKKIKKPENNFVPDYARKQLGHTDIS